MKLNHLQNIFKTFSGFQISKISEVITQVSYNTWENYFCLTKYGTKHLNLDQVKFVEDSL